MARSRKERSLSEPKIRVSDLVMIPSVCAPSRIDLSGEVGHDLVRIIVLRRDDCKDDAPLNSHVRTCKGLYVVAASDLLSS